MGYKFRYRQTVTEGGSSVHEGHFLEVSDDVWSISPLNAPWVNAGCYAGAIPANGSDIGTYSVVTWSGWNKDSVYSDMRDMSIKSYEGSSQQNLRFMAKYNSGSFTVPRQYFNWTNLREPTVTAIRDAIPYRYEVSNYSEYDPYRRQDKTVSAFGNSNSPLNIAPLEELHINNLILVPRFIIKEIEYYNYDDVADGYQSVDNSATATLYSWADIKPADNTPAGEHYDADLFDTGWKEITPVHEDGRRFQFCCGAFLVPYYGKSSNSYNTTTDTYTAGTNPDDGKVYGDRQVFGSVASEFNEYPIINTTTNMTRPCLMVMTESYNTVTGGLTYSTPTGIMFTNSMPSGNISANILALQPSWSLMSNFQTFSATTQWSSQFFTGNRDTSNLYADLDPSTSNTSPDLSIPTKIDFDVNISHLYNITDLATTVRHYIPNNNPIAFSFSKNNRNVTATNCAFFAINSLWHTIASLGCYVADDVTAAQKAPTGYYTGNNNHMYLGHMDASGITDGVMLQGGEIPASVQAGIDDIIQNTPYTPIKPTPPTPSDTDPTNPPVPSGKAEPKITGDDVKGRQDRAFHASSNSYYELSDAELKSFIDVLWAQPQSFYEAIQIAGKQTASIFDYITSLRVYPFDATALFPVGTSGQSPIFMGTGATLKKTDGTEYTLTKLTEYVNYTNFCSFHLAEFKDWRNNFLDYSPYTKVSLYLPYAGTIDLDCQMISAFSDITGCTIDVDCSIDLQSGVLTYYVFADNAYLLATQNVKVGVDIPLNGNDSLQQSINMVRNTYSNATRLLSGASSIALNAMSGNGAGAVSEALTAPVGIAEMALNTSLASRQIPVNTMPTSGSISSMLAGQDAFITIYRQKIANPANYGHAIGYKTESSHTIDSLSGWTVCRNPDLSGISATEGEKRLIADILTTGFYA